MITQEMIKEALADWEYDQTVKIKVGNEEANNALLQTAGLLGWYNERTQDQDWQAAVAVTIGDINSYVRGEYGKGLNVLLNHCRFVLKCLASRYDADLKDVAKCRENDLEDVRRAWLNLADFKTQ